jgi:hypothetical protein
MDLLNLRPYRPLGLLLFALMVGFTPISGAALSLQEVSAKSLSLALHRYAGIQELQVPFKQTKIFKDIPTRLRSEGELHVVRPDSLTWTITKPSLVSVEIKGSTVTIASGTGSDRTVQTFKASSNEKDPQARSLQAVASWFSLDPSALTKDYSVKELGSNRFQFVPRDPSATPFESLDLSLSGDGKIKDTIIHERSGDRLEIVFGEPRIKGGSGK